MQNNEKIFIAGHKGMVGSALLRKLKAEGFTNIIVCDRSELDLLDQRSVDAFFKDVSPAYVFMAAAKVGGIAANMRQPVDFLLDNLQIQNNLFRAAFATQVTKFCFLGSSCIYPRECPQPMTEDMLLTGKLEPTNEGYALAKIAGLKLAESYYKQYGFKSICPMPCNLYGTGDHFDLEKSHVLSALVRKFVDAVDSQEKTVTVWGTGVARREFMHVDDLADAVFFLMQTYDSPELINVGWGQDVSIRELAELIAQEAAFRGEIIWDTTKPDGMPRKCLDVRKLAALGYQPRIPLTDGIRKTIAEYKSIKQRGFKIQ